MWYASMFGSFLFFHLLSARFYPLISLLINISERKVNVKLNFDVGLVSDSMVASSLYPQNSCTVSPVAPILSTLNCEKTDS